MSGIAGIVQLDGAPADEQLLRRMTAALVFRGPDAQAVWVEGPVGFGHTLLRTTDESAHERQPSTLDGFVHIVADARIDARDELRSKLAARGRAVAADTPDPELILHAYHAWGEECLEHLLGDFAFAIWDAPRRRLFCARDHFGVKPFYYARAGNSLVFSNTLNCIRLHPGISDRLNEQAIGDFLLVGVNQEHGTTIFADIRRLPAAHALQLENGSLREARYWRPPTDGAIRYSRRREYIENFLHLMRRAVDDRLRCDRAGVCLSGGLDSPTVAALAQERSRRGKPPVRLTAYSVLYQRLIPDVEAAYVSTVAEHLSIPLRQLGADDYRLYERWDGPELPQPEPLSHPFFALVQDHYRQIAAENRVTLTGEGGDALLYPSPEYLLRNAGFGHRITIFSEIIRYIAVHKKFPRTLLRSTLKRRLGFRLPMPSLPQWFLPEFVARQQLQERWVKAMKRLSSADLPVPRPELHESLESSYWSHVFESKDSGTTGVTVEARHPFFDRRVVEYMLAIPPFPWCVEKELVRQATRGLLPESIRRRAKTPLQGDPIHKVFWSEAGLHPHWARQVEAVSEYVDRKRFLAFLEQGGGVDSWDTFFLTLPISLALWLNRMGLAHTIASPEGPNDAEVRHSQEGVPQA
jgi:asparagine synthase (glutamine-hydrolysing)